MFSALRRTSRRRASTVYRRVEPYTLLQALYTVSYSTVLVACAEVAQRRFVLVAAVRRNVLNTPILQTIKNGTLTNLLCFCSQDHPIVSAISENAEYGH